MTNYIPNYGGNKVEGIWRDLAKYTFLYSFDLWNMSMLYILKKYN